MATLRQFLEEHRIGSADKRYATITGMSGGKYHIPDEQYELFLDLVNKYIFVEHGRPLNLIEQPSPTGPKPLVIDLDFRYRKDRALDHPFEMEHIKTFITKLTEGINVFFDLEPYESLRYFVCLRPQAYLSKGDIKDGIHIECPDIVLSFDKQSVLRRWMLGEDAINSSFKGTGFTNSVTDIYDESCTRRQGWFLYGESKPEIPAYYLKSVLVYTPSTNDWSSQPVNLYDSRELLELLSIRYNLVPDDNDVKKESKSLYDVLSNQNSGPGPVPQNLLEVSEIPQRALVQEVCQPQPMDTSYEDLELVYQFVRECLSVDRADKYDTWYRVGLCLHSISQSAEMFNLWMEFSARSPKFNNNDLTKLRRDWEFGMRMEGNGRRLTVRSLRHWAREDNPVVYRNILERDIIDYVLHYVTPTHNHVARLMRRMFQDNYAASVNQRHTEWYEFNTEHNIWKKINQGMALRNKISIEVANMIAEAKSRFKKDPKYTTMVAVATASKSIESLGTTLNALVQKRTACTEANKIDEATTITAEIRTIENDIEQITKRQELMRSEIKDKKFQELTELETKLYNSGFKDSVMKECAGLFYEENFESSLNCNPYRIGCANGVIHLDAIKPDPKNPGKMKGMSKEEGDIRNFFEKGMPEDYVTFQAGRDLPEYEAICYTEYDPRDPIQKEIDDFFSKLFPRPELKAWVLKLLSSCLEGKNREQCYYTFQGVGGNGKSKLVDLMVMTLGDYQSSLQSTALTRKRPESGAANPDIMSIKNKRFIYMQEPDDREPLNTSRMKQFSGEDAVEARGLYADQERFKISGKLFMMCNTLPIINSMDRGTWRRIRLIPFESKFVNPGDKELGQTNVFPKDMNLNAKLRRWRGPFFSRLVHIYLTQYAISDNGTLEPVPAIVTEKSNMYREGFDSYAQFRRTRIDFDKESDQQASMADIWRAYRYWVESVGGVGKKLTQSEIKARLDEEFGRPHLDKFYIGVATFNTEEEIEQHRQQNKELKALSLAVE